MENQTSYPFKEGDIYYSVELCQDGKYYVTASVWDDVSEEMYNPNMYVTSCIDEATDYAENLNQKPCIDASF